MWRERVSKLWIGDYSVDAGWREVLLRAVLCYVVLAFGGRRGKL